MAFFDVLKQTIIGKPTNLKEPTFIQDESDAPAQIEKLEAMKKIATPEGKKQIGQDMKLLSAGISGENMVAYEFKHSYMPILILRDLYLKYKGLTAQIDYVVIDINFILIIECKKMTGDIEVTPPVNSSASLKMLQGKSIKKKAFTAQLFKMNAIWN